MVSRPVVTVAAVVFLAGISFPRSDADARGGGGFHAGMGAFHLGTHFGQPRGYPDIGRTEMHSVRPGKHAAHTHHDAWHQFGERAKWRHFAHRDFGHWHRWSGFGDNSRSSSGFDGQWHVGSALH